MKKNLFIIPGFTHQATEKPYDWLDVHYKKQGFMIQKVPIKWSHCVMSDYVEEFKRLYDERKVETNYVLGFSFGAMIACITAAELKPDKLALCSLSPYFKEDLSSLKSSWKECIGKRRLLDFKKYHFEKIYPKIHSETFVFYGEKEVKYPSLKKRCEEAAASIRNTRLVVVPDAPHDIDHPNYQKAIKNNLT